MHCRNAIRNSVKKLPGITRTEVDPPGKKVAIEFEADQVTAQQIRERIEAVGYRVV